MSVFYKSEYHVSISQLSEPFNTTNDFSSEQFSGGRETILSTGGEVGVPGIQLYRDGPILGALLSTGDETWEVKVKGNLPTNNSWCNIALRWEPLKFTDQASYETAKQEAGYDMSKLGGLQLLLNLKMIGHSLLPINECIGNNCNNDPVKEGFPKPTMILGCHKTKENPSPRNFSGGVFDELAMWHRRIPDEERHMMLGGWKEDFDQVSTDDLVNMMDNVDFSDPNQAAVALQLLQNAVSGGETTEAPFQNIFPSTSTSSSTSSKTTDPSNTNNSVTEDSVTTTEATSDSQVSPTPPPPTPPTQTQETKKAAFVNFINVMKKLSSPSIVPANLTTDDFMSKIETSKVIGDFLDMSGKYHEKWELVNEDQNIFGSHDVRQNFESYIAKTLQNLVLEPGTRMQRAEVHSENGFVQFEKISNPEVLRRQIYEDETFVFPMWRKRSKRSTGYQPYVVGDSLSKWDTFADSIEIPLMLFSGKCAEQDISVVGAVYENFPEPGRKDPVNIHSNRIKLDSRVMSIKAFANSFNRNNQEFTELCQPDPKLLYRKKLMVTLETKDKVKSKFQRQLMFHENEEKSEIVRRHCAMWNPDIGLFGAWDTVDIETVSMDENSAVCLTDKLGTYAVVAELEELPQAYDEPGWLYYTRLAGYCLSCLLLLIFVIIILTSAYLWEQFHILRLNLSVSLIAGNIAVLLGELNMIQEDRHACTVIGCLITYFYTASAFILACESHACFKAITSGIIDGKSGAYLPLAWGIPMISLGVNIFLSLMLMGDEPKCWVGWDNLVKWQFFIPLLSGAGVTSLKHHQQF